MPVCSWVAFICAYEEYGVVVVKDRKFKDIVASFKLKFDHRWMSWWSLHQVAQQKLQASRH